MNSYTAAVDTRLPILLWQLVHHTIIVFKGGGVYFPNKEVLLLANLTFTFVTNINVKLSSNKTNFFIFHPILYDDTCEVV